MYLPIPNVSVHCGKRPYMEFMVMTFYPHVCVCYFGGSDIIHIRHVHTHCHGNPPLPPPPLSLSLSLSPLHTVYIFTSWARLHRSRTFLEQPPSQVQCYYSLFTSAYVLTWYVHLYAPAHLHMLTCSPIPCQQLAVILHVHRYTCSSCMLVC